MSRIWRASVLEWQRLCWQLWRSVSQETGTSINSTGMGSRWYINFACV